MDDEHVKELVVAELRAKRVKLWLTPYYCSHTPNQTELQALAGNLAEKLPVDCTKQKIVAALLSLQTHALEKLETKKKSAAAATAHNLSTNLEIKVLGLRGNISNLDQEHRSPAESWAERVELTANTLKLHHVNPELTANKLLEDLKMLFHASAVRLVHKGQSITSTGTSQDARLVELIGRGAKTTPHTDKRTFMLCLVSYSDETTASECTSPDQTLITRIRHAATKLSCGSSHFEVTDQHGMHVPMPPTDRLAFLTALGLHRLGRKRMENNDDNLSSALVFLLEADQEWNRVGAEWRNKVDNYGLLQLDIAWVYLKLESLESLPDVTRRLEVAETVLRKQVHTNFVTLALVQADMGNAVPPLAAVFCRLFLLQGVAYRYNNNKEKSKERLDWAWSLCQSLRCVSSEQSVTALCEAVGVSKFQAISALRRTNGNPDQAAELLEKDEMDAVQQMRRREQQRRLGLCENTTDYVDLNLIPQLQSVLGLASVQALQDMNAQRMDPHYKVAAGLLRLANNDLEMAIDLYQDMERNTSTVLQRVSALDCKLQEQGIAPRTGVKRAREDQETDVVDDESVVVDEIALATLASMGVDESKAEMALLHTQNNVEMSLLWLSNQSDSGTSAVMAAEDDEFTERTIRDVSSDTTNESNSSSDQTTRNVTIRDQQESERQQAEDLLERELGVVLQERDIEKEYLGSSLEEEWSFLAKFRGD